MDSSKSPAVLIADTLFSWRSKIAKTDCRCRLKLYKITFDKTIVIVSEIPENPGRSITDEAFTLIHLVCYKFGLAPGKTMWVEHYPSGYLKETETYDEVVLGRFNICSKRINISKLESLLGISFE